MRKVLPLLVVAFGLLMAGSPGAGAAHPVGMTLTPANASHASAATVQAAPRFACEIPVMCELVGAIACKHGPCPTVQAAPDATPSSASSRRVASSGRAPAARFTCEGFPALVCTALYAATAPVCRKYPCGIDTQTIEAQAVAAPAAPAAPGVHDPLSQLCTVQTGRLPNPFCLLPAAH